MDTKQFLSSINQIIEEKGIPKDKVIETIEMAIAAAYKKDYGEKGQIIRAKLDPATGEVAMSQIKIVVDESMLKDSEDEETETEEFHHPSEIAGEEDKPRKVTFNSERHIMLEEARALKSDAALEEEIAFSLPSYTEFGRIAAQTAKQVIIQRLREAEREMVIEEFKSKEGEIITAQAQRYEWKNVIFDLGRTSGIMYYEDQIPGEHYRIGDRMKVYIVRVDITNKGPLVVVSRSCPALIKKIFELEVPEIASGAVEIKTVAREAGSRSKIAVATTQDGVDPIGSCVGQKGTRVGAVISELNGEKIDIIEWSADPAQFIANAISPAKALNVEVNEETRESRVTVAADQLSLAIGKGGQNVRLAAHLTGWKIDVKSSSAEATKDKPAGEVAESDVKSDEAGVEEKIAE